MKALMGLLFRLKQAFKGKRKPKFQRPPDPRVDAEPWLAEMLDELGERYRLGEDVPDGIQVLCRVARERFKPMRVWVRPVGRAVLGDYDVRIGGGLKPDDGRNLLDVRVTGRLGELGLRPGAEKVEEWAGLVLTRRYEGHCPDPKVAAAAVAFMCRGSEQVMQTDAEA